MPASQHQSPKSDIEIAQAAKKQRIHEIAQESSASPTEHLEPYGHYKAKVSLRLHQVAQGQARTAS